MDTAMKAYQARGIDAGTAEILEIERRNPEVAGWAQFDLREAEFQQCDLCRTLDFDHVAERTGYTIEGFGQKHHASWEAVTNAAKSGCHTCRLFYMIKLHEDQDAPSYSIRNELTHVRVCKEGPTMIIRGADVTDLRFGWSILPHDSGDKPSADYKENVLLSHRFVENDPSSNEAFARANIWVDQCVTEHKYCRPNVMEPLPTRVLDIEQVGLTGRINLFEPNGQSHKYIALSHCWGGSSGKNENIIRTCTTSNYAELKNGFEVSQMPQNFQDAVLVATKLNIRYLWIDTYCIIQDSLEDWSRESSRMSEVYGNSFLTIYASSAENSDAGFLQPRDPHRYLMTKLCPVPTMPDHWVWIRWPASDLVYSLEDAVGKLWHRSWAFQELVLPPRILDYGPLMMDWRCNKHQLSETSRNSEKGSHDGYKELMWILGLPDIDSTPTNAIPSHPQFAGHHRIISIYSRWYKMIEGFAGRGLTQERDKLPAISGLANKIQQMTGDVYMAGLWKRDIAAGLCWGARFHKDLSKPSTYISPSWSWASTAGHITYQFEEDRKFEIELVDFSLATEPLNPLGQIFSGSITVSGSVRKLDATKSTVYVEEEWDYDASKLRAKITSHDNIKKQGRVYQYALKDQTDVIDPLEGGICSLSIDTGSPAEVGEVWLLKMVVSKDGEVSKKPDTSTLVPDGIVLERVSEREEIYKRIGVYACVDAMAEWLQEPDYSALLGWERRTITII